MCVLKIPAGTPDGGYVCLHLSLTAVELSGDFRMTPPPLQKWCKWMLIDSILTKIKETCAIWYNSHTFAAVSTVAHGLSLTCPGCTQRQRIGWSPPPWGQSGRRWAHGLQSQPALTSTALANHHVSSWIAGGRGSSKRHSFDFMMRSTWRPTD